MVSTGIITVSTRYQDLYYVSDSSLGLAIDYKKTEAEQGMLLNLHKRGWTEGLKMKDFEEMEQGSQKAIEVSHQ